MSNGWKSPVRTKEYGKTVKAVITGDTLEFEAPMLHLPILNASERAADKIGNLLAQLMDAIEEARLSVDVP